MNDDLKNSRKGVFDPDTGEIVEFSLRKEMASNKHTDDVSESEERIKEMMDEGLDREDAESLDEIFN